MACTALYLPLLYQLHERCRTTIRYELVTESAVYVTPYSCSGSSNAPLRCTPSAGRNSGAYGSTILRAPIDTAEAICVFARRLYRPCVMYVSTSLTGWGGFTLLRSCRVVNSLPALPVPSATLHSGM
uniref:Uncharacterized protein n=1 Tax=Lygus hesperus TaxID=30085 RepID=A0A146M043_LYGHE